MFINGSVVACWPLGCSLTAIRVLTAVEVPRKPTALLPSMRDP